jgi:hypothetical protein
MQNVIEAREPFGRPYAEALAGPRVSWGSVLAGAVAMLAVSILLWVLGLAIVALFTRPTADSLRNSAVVLWFSAMGTTLVGAFVGGFVAGKLSGRLRRGVAMAHGFLAWALALLLSFGVQMFVLRGIVQTATDAAIEATGGAGAEPGPPATRELPRERGGAFGAPPAQAEAVDVEARAIDTLAGFGWSWFGTWFFAGLLALCGSAAGVGRLRRDEMAPPRAMEHEPPIGPLTPAPSA